jgi:hypothetical protein
MILEKLHLAIFAASFDPAAMTAFVIVSTQIWGALT